MDSNVRDKQATRLNRKYNKIKDMVKENKSNQRPAGLQQVQAQQPRLTAKEDMKPDVKIRERIYGGHRSRW